MCEPIVYSLNISIYEKYRKICPFTLQEVNIKSHLKRRCELYDTSKNSRYSYHYICSYNPENEILPNHLKSIYNFIPVFNCSDFKLLTERHLIIGNTFSVLNSFFSGI